VASREIRVRLIVNIAPYLPALRKIRTIRKRRPPTGEKG
jgi:hypothetical protein